MREAANCPSPSTTAKIEVLRGGKATLSDKALHHKGPIDLAEARRNRKSRFKPILN